MSVDEKFVTKKYKGAVAWMAQNSVAANLLMAILLVGGFIMAQNIKQEVFPEFELDIITIQVPYPGASPAEVEQGVVLVVEEAVRGLDGVKKVTASARESVGVISVEILTGEDADAVLSDVKNAVDRITSFPQDAERPIVSLANNRSEVISLVLYGDTNEKTLRALAERHREGLLQLDDVTQVDLAGTRPLEISIEVPQEELRAHNLSLAQIANRVRAASVEIPGGGIKTPSGEVLVRTDERRNLGTEFGEIQIVGGPAGSDVRLGDIANIKDGFQDNDQETYFNGQRAIRIMVFRIGDQTPIEVAAAVRGYMDEEAGGLPPGIEFAIWSDRSEIYRDRVNLLLKNALIGLILVFGALGLFLQPKLAFWVTLGIPISFLGSMLVMPSINVSINMISLFAFIVTLGMVVDDAIVVGENIFSKRQEGMPFMQAAVEGAQEVAMPVIFAILTSVAAFMPMLFVPGAMGKIFAVIPAIVISVLLLSLVESLLILPAHLAHGTEASTTGVFGFINGQQKKVSKALERFIKNIYQPVLAAALRWRYLTIAICVAIFISTIGMVAGGRVDFSFFPKIDGDTVTASVRMPVGAPIEDAKALRVRLERAAQEVIDAHGGDAIIRGKMTQLGSSIAGGGPRGGTSSVGGHILDMAVFMVPTDQRNINAGKFADQWRKAFGDVPGVDSLSFKYNIGPSAGNPIDIQLSHYDTEVLERASKALSEALRNYTGVIDIEDGFADGKPQLNFQLKPEAMSLGITESDLGRQLRASFFGQEAVRQQRGRNEIRTYVRLPESERQDEQALSEILLRTPQGGEVPLKVAAEIVRGRSATEIKRSDARRVVNVTADLEAGVANANKVLASVRAEVMPGLEADYPGLSFSLEGEQRQQADSLESLRTGMVFALLAIFALLAVPFRSYVQPLIIMSAIPFGVVGAVLGHVAMDMELSLMSIFGIIALMGIVVNDSLVLVVFVNRLREEGKGIMDAVRLGSMGRFRPIVLTSLTTFLGLAPMVLETSVQARFLVPMAISLAFGVMFATFIILLLVPAFYVVLEDIRHLLTKRTFVTETTGIDDPDPDTPDVTGVQEGRL